ncbi:sensor histidine kinase [Sphingobacterium sp. JUb56]|uniref:sensor histidine kinase n=1 Tax=Sphingobacterium sp. JUb56 TaxID=2587145 RepID=UPI00160A3E2D|nr:histidine kinase [Sphingobacterium sp. JUb56]MBB2952127.1 hypothetical protein [Sphingobacterium sp. JUb56]
MRNGQIIIGYENSHFIDFVIDSKYRWIRHVLLIAAIIGIHFLPNNAPAEVDEKMKVWNLLVKCISIIILLALFYINHYVLIPVFMLRSKFLAYGGTLFAFYSIIFLSMLILESQELRFIKKPDQSLLDGKDFVILIILFTIFIAAVSSVKLFKIWIINLIRFKEFENNTLLSQLEQLKSQINPHYLFNTLNNINFLIDENPKLASKVLLKLSDILRNQLYLSKGDTIELAKEIEVLQNIIFLEEIRRDKFSVNFEVDLSVEEINIPPFLFIPFIENVVKHGAHQAMHGGLHVQINFNVVNEQLCFSCVNAKKKKVSVKEYGGLGLSNIRKRLDIIYANRYNLAIDDGEDVFKVFLSIPIEGSYEYRAVKH